MPQHKLYIEGGWRECHNTNSTKKEAEENATTQTVHKKKFEKEEADNTTLYKTKVDKKGIDDTKRTLEGWKEGDRRHKAYIRRLERRNRHHKAYIRRLERRNRHHKAYIRRLYRKEVRIGREYTKNSEPNPNLP